MSTIDYTARLHSTTADGILAHTSELYDTEESKFQSAINKEVGNKLTELEQNIGSKISGVYKVKGTKATIAEVLKEPLTKGDVWNIESEFTLKGKKYPAGTNVVAINTTQVEDSLDPLGGTVDVQDILNKAAADATTKANNAKQQAIETASTDATNKAGTAKSEAIEAAASDATSKADAAKEAAITAAAKDADNKANTAKQGAIEEATRLINATKEELNALIAKGKIKTVFADALDSMITSSTAIEFIQDPNNSTYVVLYSSDKPYVVGVLNNISDNMHHTIEQHFITHYYFENGKTISGHQHDILREWTRAFVMVEGLVKPVCPWNSETNLTHGYVDREYATQSYLTTIGISEVDFKLDGSNAWPKGKYSPWRCYHDEYLAHELKLQQTADGKISTAQSTATEAKNKVAQVEGTLTTTQQSLASLAQNVGGFTYSQFTALQEKVTALENLLKLA